MPSAVKSKETRIEITGSVGMKNRMCRRQEGDGIDIPNAAGITLVATRLVELAVDRLDESIAKRPLGLAIGIAGCVPTLGPNRGAHWTSKQ